MDLANMAVATLVRHRPWLEEVLSWYDLDAATLDPTITVATLCWTHRLDTARFLKDLQVQPPTESVEWGFVEEPMGPLPGPNRDPEIEDPLWLDEEPEPEPDAPLGWWEEFVVADLRVHGRRYHP